MWTLAIANLLVVAFPLRNRGRAEALGHAVAHVLDALPSPEVDAAVTAAASVPSSSMFT